MCICKCTQSSAQLPIGCSLAQNSTQMNLEWINELLLWHLYEGKSCKALIDGLMPSQCWRLLLSKWPSKLALSLWNCLIFLMLIHYVWFRKVLIFCLISLTAVFTVLSLGRRGILIPIHTQTYVSAEGDFSQASSIDPFWGSLFVPYFVCFCSLYDSEAKSWAISSSY